MAPAALATKKRGHGMRLTPAKSAARTSEKGNEAAEEDDFAAMLHEEILPDLDARLGQADIVPIAHKHREADFPPDPIPNIVPHDGANGSRGNDLGNAETPCLARIDGRGNKYRLARQRQAHAFQANHPGYRK